MIIKLKLNNDDGTIKEMDKNFTSNDVKRIESDGKLPINDKAGEYLYVVSFKSGATLPYYYYKMSDKCTVPCSTGVSIRNNID